MDLLSLGGVFLGSSQLYPGMPGGTCWSLTEGLSFSEALLHACLHGSKVFSSSCKECISPHLALLCHSHLDHKNSFLWDIFTSLSSPM